MSFISKIKSFVGINDTPRGQFYPLLNSSYSDNHLSGSDYIRLYTSWAYTAVSTIANTCSSVEYSITKGINSTSEFDHKHRRLITYSLINQVVSFLQLSGTCFLYKYKIWERVDDLWVLRTDQVEPFEDVNGIVKYYNYTSGWKVYQFLPEELIDISLFNPYQGYPRKLKGISPMAAAAMDMEIDQVSSKWNRQFFKNGASVGQVLKAPEKLATEVKERAIESRRLNYWWVNNSHKVAFLDGGTTLDVIGANKKELDFVESRRFTRDMVYEIFKLPKAILGNYDNTGNNSAKEAENSYFRNCIQPILKLIEEKLNKELFPDADFRFVNYLPKDTVQLAKDLELWAISINEYRKERWYAPIKWGDDLWDKKETPVKGKYDDVISKAFRKHIKGTKEYDEARDEKNQLDREQKQARVSWSEVRLENAIKTIFDAQKRDALDKINKKNRFSKVKYSTMWMTLVKPIIEEVMQNEGTQALSQVWLNQIFRVWENKIQSFIKDSISLMSNKADEYTMKELDRIITEGNNQWYSTDVIANMISSKFEDYTSKRSQTIARTEITRASNQASIYAWENTWVVSKKERFTARDERVCEQCWPMNGKIIPLWDNYFNKWDVYNGVKLDYTAISSPPLHPACRCTLLPVIE